MKQFYQERFEEKKNLFTKLFFSPFMIVFVGLLIVLIDYYTSFNYLQKMEDITPIHFFILIIVFYLSLNLVITLFNKFFLFNIMYPKSLKIIDNEYTEAMELENNEVKNIEKHDLKISKIFENVEKKNFTIKRKDVILFGNKIFIKNNLKNLINKDDFQDITKNLISESISEELKKSEELKIKLEKENKLEKINQKSWN